MGTKYLLAALVGLMITLYPLSAQNAPKKIKITGSVMDHSNNPVVGAIITIDRIQSKCATNQEGKFSLKVPSSAIKLGVFITSDIILEEAISGRTEINMVISDSAGRIIAEQKTRQKEATKEKNYNNYNNIYDMIRASDPSVQISGTSICIRGANSFMCNTQPLIIVDGAAVEGISNISPQEVASIDVLKGPDTSIYGSRGANGVIVITLKKSGK